MNKALATSMHILVLGALATIVAILMLSYFDPYNYNDGSGELGNSLFYSLLYLCALVAGFAGLILSVVLLKKEKGARTKQSTYAAVYLVLGLLSALYAYYLAQAS